MENTQVGLRELYDCVFLATIDMEIGSRKVRAGEPVVIFDNIQSFGLDERKRRVDAKGGYQNASRVYWENSTKAVVHFRQGTFSKTTLSMLGNAAMVEEDRVIDNVQRVELDENKKVVSTIPTTSDSLFDFEEALNPNLSLKDIMDDIMTEKKEDVLVYVSSFLPQRGNG